MTQQAVNNFVEFFDSNIKQAYQGVTKLRDTVYEKRVPAATAYFPIFGSGVAATRNSLDEVQYLGITQDRVSCKLNPWDAADLVAIEHMHVMNFDERKELVDALGAAIGRRIDQEIINALVAGVNTTDSVAADAGNSQTRFSFDHIKEARKLFQKREIPADGRTLLITAEAEAGLLSDDKVANEDYRNTYKAKLAASSDGCIDSFLGFRIIVMGNRDEGGLSSESSNDVCLAYHKRAIGLAVASDKRVEVEKLAHRKAYQVDANFHGGAKVIDSEGVFKVLSPQ